MVISIQFKDSKKIFRGKAYDYKLNKEEKVPKKGSIIRMMDNDYNYIHYGTRVKVVNVREDEFTDIDLNEIRYVDSNLD